MASWVNFHFLIKTSVDAFERDANFAAPSNLVLGRGANSSLPGQGRCERQTSIHMEPVQEPIRSQQGIDKAAHIQGFIFLLPLRPLKERCGQLQRFAAFRTESNNSAQRVHVKKRAIRPFRCVRPFQSTARCIFDAFLCEAVLGCACQFLLRGLSFAS